MYSQWILQFLVSKVIRNDVVQLEKHLLLLKPKKTNLKTNKTLNFVFIGIAFIGIA